MPRANQDSDPQTGAIPFVLTRSRTRKRTIEIRVEPNGRVRVSAPYRTSVKTARELVERRAGWILRKQNELAARRPSEPLTPGCRLPFLGRDLRLEVSPGRVHRVAVTAGFDALRVDLPGGRAPELRTVLETWYRGQALCHLSQRVEHWSRLMGVRATAVEVRTQRRRWGSCSPSGVLRFNWRLVMAAPALIDYVVVHELAHLRHLNHSPAFHQEVARWLPAHRELRKRLHSEGEGYQRVLEPVPGPVSDPA